jgi:hypothetical protein
VRVLCVALVVLSACTQVDTEVQVEGPVVLLSTDAIDFGAVSCGATAPQQSFVISNPGGTAFKWTASLGRGNTSPYTLSVSAGTINPGGNVQIDVTPNAVSANASTTIGALNDTVTVLTNIAQSSPSRIALKQTARGAQLTFSSTKIDFGAVPLVQTQNAISVRNSGSAPALVTLQSSGTGFSVPSVPVTIGAGELFTTFVTFAPTSTAPATGNITLGVSSDDVLCGALPAPLQLSASASNAEISVSPATLSFGDAGLTDCGATAAPKTVTISNASSADTAFSAALGRGPLSPYVVSSGGGVVPANGSVTLTLTPKQIPATSAVTAGLYNDTLVVTTRGFADTPHTVALEQTARGYILARSSGSIAFGSVAVGQPISQLITLTNTGNAPVDVTHVAGLSEFSVASGMAVTVAAGATVPVTVAFTASQPVTTADAATVVVSETSARCNPLPASLTLSGTGTTPTLVAFPGTLNFGSLDCGSNPLKVDSFDLTNRGAATNVTLQLNRDAASQFEISENLAGPYTAIASVAFAAAQVKTIYIRTRPVSSVSSVATNGLADTLQVLGDNGATTTVTLNATARGVVLELRQSPATGNTQGNIAFGTFAHAATVSSPPAARFVAFNTGNAEITDLNFTILPLRGPSDSVASYRFSTGVPASAPTGPTGSLGATLNGNTSALITLEFAPPNANATSREVRFEAAASATVFCGQSIVQIQATGIAN